MPPAKANQDVRKLQWKSYATPTQLAIGRDLKAQTVGMKDPTSCTKRAQAALLHHNAQYLDLLQE